MHGNTFITRFVVIAAIKNGLTAVVNNQDVLVR